MSKRETLPTRPPAPPQFFFFFLFSTAAIRFRTALHRVRREGGGGGKKKKGCHLFLASGFVLSYLPAALVGSGRLAPVYNSDCHRTVFWSDAPSETGSAVTRKDDPNRTGCSYNKSTFGSDDAFEGNGGGKKKKKKRKEHKHITRSKS